MANELQLAKLKQGPKAWNQWRSQQSHYYYVNLSNADLTGVDLFSANLCEADLRQSNLSGADLNGADLCMSNLSGADLSGANLGDADLRQSNLNGANLSGANLSNANFNDAILSFANLSNSILFNTSFTSADLKNANLTNAKLLETTFGNTDLINVIGLEEITHLGPSILDHRTIERSGVLPVNFLRGCGLPDSLIDYLPPMLNRAISFYSCFISYSHADKAFARRLHDQLQGRGIRCWLDEHQLLPGDDIYEQVDQGIKLWDKVLLCASIHALTSWWVDNEIDTAFRKEQQLMRQRGKKVWLLIPLDLDGYMFSGKWERGYAAQVKSRLAADFTGWEKDNDKFEQAFKNLINALKTDDCGREPPPIPRL